MTLLKSDSHDDDIFHGYKQILSITHVLPLAMLAILRPASDTAIVTPLGYVRFLLVQASKTSDDY